MDVHKVEIVELEKGVVLNLYTQGKVWHLPGVVEGFHPKYQKLLDDQEARIKEGKLKVQRAKLFKKELDEEIDKSKIKAAAGKAAEKERQKAIDKLKKKLKFDEQGNEV